MLDEYFICGFVELIEFKNRFLAKSGSRKIPKSLLKSIHNSNRSTEIGLYSLALLICSAKLIVTNDLV